MVSLHLEEGGGSCDEKETERERDRQRQTSVRQHEPRLTELKLRAHSTQNSLFRGILPSQSPGCNGKTKPTQQKKGKTTHKMQNVERNI